MVDVPVGPASSAWSRFRFFWDMFMKEVDEDWSLPGYCLTVRDGAEEGPAVDVDCDGVW